MAGWGFWVLAALYIVVDLKKWWTGSPFSVVGMNSILLYILHETLADQIPFCGSCGHVNDSHEIRMAMNVGAVTVWVLYAYYIGVGTFRNLEIFIRASTQCFLRGAFYMIKHSVF